MLKKLRARATSGEPAPATSSDATHRELSSLTDTWFSAGEIEAICRRYTAFTIPVLGYATVADFVDSYEHLNPLATAQGDLKDVQRPWMLKAILGSVPRGGRLLEIGGGQPYVADLLARAGYEVWLVDPYDGSGNGPTEFETFRAASPSVRFVRELFGPHLTDVPAQSFDCVYSISVLEHLDEESLDSVTAGLRRCLTPAGRSIHAVDHVHRGRGAEGHLSRLRHLCSSHGIDAAGLDGVLATLDDDTETYYLSAESHNRWRGNTPYHDFPMRVCVSVQLGTRGLAGRPTREVRTGS